MNERLLIMFLFIKPGFFLEANNTKRYTKFQEKHIENASQIIQNLSRVRYAAFMSLFVLIHWYSLTDKRRAL